MPNTWMPVQILLKPIPSAPSVISLADYKLEELAYELSFEGARLAREVAEEYTKKIRTSLVLWPALLGQQTVRLPYRQM
jgi:methionine synthase I (cobalamin-dependent)